MKYQMIAALAGVSLLVAATTAAEAGNRGHTWCRHLQNSDSPMTWREGYGISSCNDRAATPYNPWRNASPIRRKRTNTNDPMTAYRSWRGNTYFSGYDNRYDDRYDRRSRRYR